MFAPPETPLVLVFVNKDINHDFSDWKIEIEELLQQSLVMLQNEHEVIFYQFSDQITHVNILIHALWPKA